MQFTGRSEPPRSSRDRVTYKPRICTQEERRLVRVEIETTAPRI